MKMYYKFFHKIYYYIKNKINILFYKNDIIIIKETKLDYQNIILPYINSILYDNTKWINNIINDIHPIINYNNNILYKNTKFVIVKDIVWQDDNYKNFYILAIPIKKILSIRELTIDDIPLLFEMERIIYDISKQYGINKNNLYLFFHYQPSYYQLHLHACIINNQFLQNKYKRHYFLDDIINLLLLKDLKIKDLTLTYEISTNNIIYSLLKNYKN